MKDKDAFLTLARKRLDRSVKKDEHNRTAAIDDLKFLNADNGDQWDEGEKKRRELHKRPMLQINLLPKFVDQVTGDQRMNRPRVKVRPVDSKADPAIAKIREGIIWNVEYLSNAEAIYDEACEMQVSCGYGAWRVLTRYCEDAPFLQEMYLAPIDNPFLVYMDTEAKDFMFADANWAFILDRMPKEEFEETYPKEAEKMAEALDFGQGVSEEHWYSDDNVTVAEYFVRERVKQMMVQLADGDIMPEADAEQKIAEWDELNAATQLALMTPNADMGAGPGLSSFPPAPAAPVPMPMAPPIPPRPEIVKRRETDKIVVKRYVITFNEVIKEETVPGSFIPIVLLRGRKRNIEGKTFVRGLIRDGKDPQRLFNYWTTSAAEVVALAPKAPFIGTAKQFEGYEDDYATANVNNYPFLKYNADAEAAGPPQRMGMGDVPVAIFSQIQQAQENLKSVVGMFNRDVGDQGPEMSGVALTRAQTPSDVATFAFIDNLARAIAHSGRIMNDMIPEIYDTERDVRLRNIDDTETFAPINTTALNALKAMQGNPERYQGMDVKKLKKSIQKEGPDATFNDITAGKYGVVVTVGPSFTTQRQESADNMMKLVQAAPNLMGMAGDLIVRNMDFKDADELAERLEKTLPPGLRKLKEGEEPPPPPPPDPNVLISQAMVQIENIKLETNKQKLFFDQAIYEMKLEAEKLKTMREGMAMKQTADSHQFDMETRHQSHMMNTANAMNKARMAENQNKGGNQYGT